MRRLPVLLSNSPPPINKIHLCRLTPYHSTTRYLLRSCQTILQIPTARELSPASRLLRRSASPPQSQYLPQGPLVNLRGLGQWYRQMPCAQRPFTSVWKHQPDIFPWPAPLLQVQQCLILLWRERNALLARPRRCWVHLGICDSLRKVRTRRRLPTWAMV
jgi:hypothetical protein